MWYKNNKNKKIDLHVGKGGGGRGRRKEGMKFDVKLR
jgi:hypothetical protein